MKIKERKDLHLLRKIGHIVPGLVFFIAYWFFEDYRSFIESWIMKIFIIATFFDFLRLRIPKLNLAIIKVFSGFLRKDELGANSGMPSYLAGLAILSAFFPTKVIVLSVAYLSFCDPFASLGGLYFKDNEHNIKFKNGKSLFGFFSSFIVGLLITIIIGIILFNWSFTTTFTIGVLASLLVSYVESFPLEGLNDNILVPLLSAIFLSILLPLLGVSYV